MAARAREDGFGKATHTSILERGKLIRKSSNPKGLAYFPDNGDLTADLFQRFRMEWVCGTDGLPLDPTGVKEWVAIGEKGQLWEYGRGILGVSVEGEKWTPSFIRQVTGFCTVTQNGGGEANLKCGWTPENVERLAKLLKLRKSPKILSEAKRQALKANLKAPKALSKAVAGTQDASEGAK